MTSQKPRFRLEELDLQTDKDARISNRAYAKPDEHIIGERTYCSYECTCFDHCTSQ